jgi:hypothetical protein
MQQNHRGNFALGGFPFPIPMHAAVFLGIFISPRLREVNPTIPPPLAGRSFCFLLKNFLDEIRFSDIIQVKGCEQAVFLNEG